MPKETTGMNFTTDGVANIPVDDIEMHRRVLRSNAPEAAHRISRAALDAACKTPGAVYNISTLNPPQVISLSVTIPNTVERLDEEQAEAVEQELHDAAERILARFFACAREEAKRRYFKTLKKEA